MKCFTLWTVDLWLMRRSFELHGIFDSLDAAIEVAQKQQLKISENHIVIYSGEVNNYDSTCQKVFSTEFDKDRKILEN